MKMWNGENNSSMESFRYKLQKEDVISLYGYNRRSKQLIQSLKNNGYIVNCLIDQAYRDLHNEDGVLFCDLEKYKAIEKSKNETVIICLNDGMKHPSIAKKLYEIGIRWVLFQPMDINIPILQQREIRNTMSMLDRDLLDDIYGFKCDMDCKEPFRIIDKQMDKVSFWCPISYVYSHGIDLIKKAVEERHIIHGELWDKYADVPISENMPYINLFSYLNGKNVDISEYTLFNRNTEIERKQLVENRKHLWELYENSWIYNMELFIDAPSPVKWNELGHFNLLDGNHRSIYLFMKGLREIPVVTSKDDYQKFRKVYLGK